MEQHSEEKKRAEDAVSNIKIISNHVIGYGWATVCHLLVCTDAMPCPLHIIQYTRCWIVCILTVVDVLGYVCTLPDVEQWVGWLDFSEFPLPQSLVHESK